MLLLGPQSRSIYQRLWDFQKEGTCLHLTIWLALFLFYYLSRLNGPWKQELCLKQCTSAPSPHSKFWKVNPCFPQPPWNVQDTLLSQTGPLVGDIWRHNPLVLSCAGLLHWTLAWTSRLCFSVLRSLKEKLFQEASQDAWRRRVTMETR